jgi:hypothetical protein
MQQNDDGNSHHRVRAHFSVFGKIHEKTFPACMLDLRYLGNSHAELHEKRLASPHFGVARLTRHPR